MRLGEPLTASVVALRLAETGGQSASGVCRGGFGREERVGECGYAGGEGEPKSPRGGVSRGRDMLWVEQSNGHGMTGSKHSLSSVAPAMVLTCWPAPGPVAPSVEVAGAVHVGEGTRLPHRQRHAKPHAAKATGHISMPPPAPTSVACHCSACLSCRAHC